MVIFVVVLALLFKVLARPIGNLLYEFGHTFNISYDPLNFVAQEFYNGSSVAFYMYLVFIFVNYVALVKAQSEYIEKYQEGEVT